MRITTIPELHPNKLLYPPYDSSTDSLAEVLGVSKYTVESWLYNKRSPQSPVKRLCYLVSTGELIATKSESWYKSIDISKNTQTLILTIFSGAIATYEDS